jgi:phospholipid/cholesterol/gamma-HCH transport system ATP-binding protein
MGGELIEFRDVTKRFDEQVVLDHLNLTLEEGLITAVIGKSGTGKSVFIKHIIGLLSPDEGTILFRGKDINKMDKAERDSYKREFSFMFQNNALFDSMNVFDNIALPLKQTTRMSRKEIHEKVTKRISQMELDDVSFKYPAELSGGMQKRVALARALVTDPKVVLFDEPTTGQDPIRKNAILSMIARYRKRYGFTAVIISHDIPDIFFISDRIVLLWEGKVAFHGTYEEITKLNHPLIGEFLQSLEGYQDELTGLLSKQLFRSRYEKAFSRRPMEKRVSAVLFSIELERISDAIGPVAALSVVKSLGEYINENLDALGGFSTRQSRNDILTILPHVGPEEAGELVENFGRVLQQGGLSDIRISAGAGARAGACYEIQVLAGVVTAENNDAIEDIVRQAKSVQRSIAVYRCGMRSVDEKVFG